jgi:hypothetical protein
MRFLAATAAVLVVVAVLARGAQVARAGLLPTWRGAPARLAEAVIALSAGFGAAQFVGALRLFRPLPLLLALLAAGAACWGLGRLVHVDDDAAAGIAPAPTEDDRPAPVRHEPLEWMATLLGVGIIAVQWMTHVGASVGRGMNHPDTLWYHLPFAARFVQNGSFTGLEGIGYVAARWFPFNSQMLHAQFMVAYGDDAFSPYLNLAWAAMALLAAWCIGTPRGNGPLALLLAAFALGIPAMAGTQPGQASSDIACAALLLAAVALLLEAEDFAPVPLALAGLATGLAISTKVTIAVPIAVLVIGVLVTTLVARRFAVSALWAGAVGLTGSFWFVRNWVSTGSPLPWFDLALGPVTLSATAAEEGPPLSDTIFDGDAWETMYRPGLAQGFGRAWPFVLAIAVAGIVLALVKGPRFARLAGLMVLAGLIGHAFTPLTGGLSFVFNLRYLTPVLLLGFVLFARQLPATRAWRAAMSTATLLLVVVGATSANREGVEAWPKAYVVPIALGAVLAAVLAALYVRSTDQWPARRHLTVAALAAGLVLAGTWSAQQYYLDHRYLDAGLHMDEVHEYFRGVTDARIAVFGTDETYPMFGIDGSNRVRRGDDAVIPLTDDFCRDWRRALAGHYDYVVLTQYGIGNYRKPSDWIIRTDDAATLVVRDGRSAVYRLDGALDPSTCPEPETG